LLSRYFYSHATYLSALPQFIINFKSTTTQKLYLLINLGMLFNSKLSFIFLLLKHTQILLSVVLKTIQAYTTAR